MIANPMIDYEDFDHFILHRNEAGELVHVTLTQESLADMMQKQEEKTNWKKEGF